MVLLIAAGLLLRGLFVAQTIDPGFEMQNVASVSFELRNQGYDDRRAALFQRNLLGARVGLPEWTPWRKPPQSRSITIIPELRFLYREIQPSTAWSTTWSPRNSFPY